ncbi:hypothetical protein NQZ68_007813 [Dissostichus eleginoides]|nr:hypothetical protein NQZ68_007813 [Dissostichus eleginoides]
MRDVLLDKVMYVFLPLQPPAPLHRAVQRGCRADLWSRQETSTLKQVLVDPFTAVLLISSTGAEGFSGGRQHRQNQRTKYGLPKESPPPSLQPLTIKRTEVEQTDIHKFLDLLKTDGGNVSLSPYSGLIERPAVWFGNTTQAQRKSLQRAIRTAERIICPTDTLQEERTERPHINTDGAAEEWSAEGRPARRPTPQRAEPDSLAIMLPGKGNGYVAKRASHRDQPKD